MAFNSSSQISYLVLDSLSNGSKYGLEIIEYISQKTGGNYILKKPTLYSCLTRMEKKGLVSSSYWGESELGGKRHYYTITDDGKRELEQLSVEFQNLTFTEDTSSASATENTSPANTSTSNETTISNPVIDFVNTMVEKDESDKNNTENKPVFLQQDNFFDMVKPTPKKEEPKEEESDIIDNQIDIFSFQATLPKETTQEEQTTVTPTENEDNKSTEASDEEKMKYYQKILEQTPQQDDAKFLDANEKLTPIQEAQNRTIYDTSSDLKKYRKRKSFSENQIEMAMVYENAEEKEIQKERIEQLKRAMLNTRQGNTPANIYRPEQKTTVEIKPQENAFSAQEANIAAATTISIPASNNTSDETKDDAVFITHRIDASQMPIQKKISPTNIEVNIYDDNLPAPKRNSELEPTYKDMMAKLFERKKEKTPQPTQPTQAPIIEEEPQVQSFTDYNSLKRYYSTHGIEFKEYRKSNVTRHHNTNFLNFINSAILLLLSGIGCSILYGIISALQLAKSETNFMFYTLPILFLVYFIYTGIKYKVVPSKKATLTYNAIINWAIALLASIIVFVINVMCGMQFETMSAFLTTLLVPIFAILLIFPVNYYIKKFIYKKYAK